jgi:hypothetical protein
MTDNVMAKKTIVIAVDNSKVRNRHCPGSSARHRLRCTVLQDARRLRIDPCEYAGLYQGYRFCVGSLSKRQVPIGIAQRFHVLAYRVAVTAFVQPSHDKDFKVALYIKTYKIDPPSYSG